MFSNAAAFLSGGRTLPPLVLMPTWWGLQKPTTDGGLLWLFAFAVVTNRDDRSPSQYNIIYIYIYMPSFFLMVVGCCVLERDAIIIDHPIKTIARPPPPPGHCSSWYVVTTPADNAPALLTGSTRGCSFFDPAHVEQTSGMQYMQPPCLRREASSLSTVRGGRTCGVRARS